MTATIVLNYNDSDTVIGFLERAKKLPSLGIIIVVDNCSTDNSMWRLEKYISSRVLLIKTEKNDGYAAGNNFGIKFAESVYPEVDTLIVSNPDITIAEDDIKQILDALNQGYDMSTGVIYNYNPRTGEKKVASNFAWRIPSYWDMVSNCFLCAYKFRRKVIKNNIYFETSDFDNKYLNVQAVPGCFFAIKDSAMREVGYFDEDTFLFEEETILGKKLYNAEKKICVVGCAKILHENSASIKKTIRSKKRQDSILLESECVYLKKYCDISYFGLVLYRIIHKIGFFEKMIITYLKRVVCKW